MFFFFRILPSVADLNRIQTTCYPFFLKKKRSTIWFLLRIFMLLFLFQTPFCHFSHYMFLSHKAHHVLCSGLVSPLFTFSCILYQSASLWLFCRSKVTLYVFCATFYIILIYSSWPFCTIVLTYSQLLAQLFNMYLLWFCLFFVFKKNNKETSFSELIWPRAFPAVLLKMLLVNKVLQLLSILKTKRSGWNVIKTNVMDSKLNIFKVWPFY